MVDNGLLREYKAHSPIAILSRSYGRLGWRPYQPGGYSLLLISHLPGNIYGITIISKDETNKMNINQNPLPTEQVGIGKRISNLWNSRTRKTKLIILATGLVLNCCCIVIPLSSKLWNTTKSLIQKGPLIKRPFSFYPSFEIKIVGHTGHEPVKLPFPRDGQSLCLVACKTLSYRKILWCLS